MIKFFVLPLLALSACVTATPPAVPSSASPGSDATPPAPPPKKDEEANVLKLTGHWDALNAIALSRDGRVAATGSDDMTVRLWDLTTGKERARLQGHAQPVAAVALSPDGTKVASGSHDTRIIVWDVASGRRLLELAGHTQFVSALMFASDGTRLFSGSHDGTVRIWDVATGKSLRRLAGHRRTVNALALSADGTLASGGDDKLVLLWNLQSGKVRRRLLGHAGWVTALTFTADGQRLVSASADHSARLWEVATGRELMRYTGPRGPIGRLRLVDGERMLVTGGGAEALIPDPKRDDFSVRVFRVADGVELARFGGHTGPVAWIHDPGNGRTVATAGLDETLRTWTLPSPEGGPRRAMLPTAKP